MINWFDLSSWENDDELAPEGFITNFVPMTKEQDEINILLLALPPPPLILAYDYIAMADDEYDITTDRLRRWILKAPPHARIWCQVGTLKIIERNQHLSS